MTREEKIRLLKGICDGTRFVNELRAHSVEFWSHESGMYVNTQTGKTLREAEFPTRHNGKGNLHTVIFENYSGK